MHETNLNTELLSADARGRKTVPFAVFAVIFIHIVLFLVLLIAAGCRARARAKMKAHQQQEVAAAVTNAPATLAPAGPREMIASANEQVEKPGAQILATEPEPEMEPTPEAAHPSPAVMTRNPAAETQPAARAVRAGIQVHTVQHGDTIGKIARQYKISIRAIRSENNLKGDLIRVGQKLRITVEKPERKDQTLAAL